jgi:phosphoserine phosphatase
MLTKRDVQILLDLQSILIRYENNPSLAERLAIMKEMAAKNYAFAIGRIADSESYEHEVHASPTQIEKDQAEKYRQILAITRGDNQPFG